MAEEERIAGHLDLDGVTDGELMAVSSTGLLITSTGYRKGGGLPARKDALHDLWILKATLEKYERAGPLAAPEDPIPAREAIGEGASSSEVQPPHCPASRRARSRRRPCPSRCATRPRSDDDLAAKRVAS